MAISVPKELLLQVWQRLALPAGIEGTAEIRQELEKLLEFNSAHPKARHVDWILHVYAYAPYDDAGYAVVRGQCATDADFGEQAFEQMAVAKGAVPVKTIRPEHFNPPMSFDELRMKLWDDAAGFIGLDMGVYDVVNADGVRIHDDDDFCAGDRETHIDAILVDARTRGMLPSQMCQE